MLYAELIVLAFDWLIDHLQPLFWMTVGSLLVFSSEYIYQHLAVSIHWK